MVRGPAYTRIEYIHGAPPPRIAKFTMGNPHGKFDYRVSLVAIQNGRITHNALEAIRVTSNKIVSVALKDEYFLQVKKYPHHVVRSNKMLAFAGADRIQKGMRLAFGAPVSRVADVKRGDIILDVRVNANGIEVAKEALKAALKKISVPCRIEVEKLIGN